MFYFDDVRYSVSRSRRWFPTAEEAVDRAAYLCITGIGATRGVFAKDGALVADSDEIWRIGNERYSAFADLADRD